MSTADSWSLERQGYPSPLFILQRHLPLIKVGRSTEVQLQCSARHVSRQHFEFRRRLESDGKTYWSIRDVGSSSKTFVNGYVIPAMQDISLNDRDVISVGSLDTPASAKNRKDVFVYVIRAPINWTSAGDSLTSTNNNDLTLRDDAVTPPPDVRSDDEIEISILPAIKKEPDDSFSPGNFGAKDNNKEDRRAATTSQNQHASPTASSTTSSSAKVLNSNEGEPRKGCPKKTTENETGKSKVSVQRDINLEPLKSDGNKSGKHDKSEAEDSNKSTSASGMTNEDKNRKTSTNTSKNMLPVVQKLNIPKGAISAKVTKNLKILSWIYDRNRYRKHFSKSSSHKRQSSESSSASEGRQTTSKSPKSKMKSKSSRKEEDRHKSKAVDKRKDRSKSSSPKQRSSSSEKKDSPLRRSNSQFLSFDDGSSDNSVSIFESPKRKKARLEEQNLSVTKQKSEEKETDSEMRSRSNVRELSRSRSVSPIDDEFASPRPLIEVEKPTSDETASKSAGKDQNEIENLTSSQASDNEVSILSEGVDDGPCNFSQVEEIIIIDSDDEFLYLSQHLDKEVPIKEEHVTSAAEEEEEEFNFDLEFDRQNSDSDDDVVCLNNELENNPLFIKISSRIKQEIEDSSQDLFESSQPRSPPPEARLEDKPDEENDSDSDHLYNLPSPTRVGQIATEFSSTSESSDSEPDQGKESDSDSEVERIRTSATKIKGVIDSDCEDVSEDDLQVSPEVAGSKDSTDRGQSIDIVDSADVGKSDDVEGQFRQISEKDPKTAKLISALPQPCRRRGFLRGISEETAKKLIERKNHRRDKQRAAKSSPVAAHNWLGKSSPGPRSRRPVDIIEKRKQKLKELAQKDQESKDRVDHKSSATKPHTAKVFQAEPRLAKLQLTDLDFLARPTTKQKPKEAPTTSRPNVGLSTSTAEAAQPSTSTSLLPPTTTNRVGPRKVAETMVVDNGQHRIVKKMTFSNVLTNVDSQCLTSDPPVATVKPLQYKSILPLPVPPARLGQKSVRWKDHEKSGQLVKVRFIPPEGKGNKVGQGQKECSNGNALPLPVQLPPVQILPGACNMRLPVEQRGEPVPKYQNVLAKILKWHTKWLEEQENLKEEPPVEGEGMKINHVPTVFSGLSDYCRTFYPLMLHDLWASVYKDYVESKGRSSELFGCVTSKPRNRRDCDEIWELDIYGLMTVEETRADFGPSEGWLVRLDLRYAPGEGIGPKGVIKPCFGFIEHSRIFNRSKGNQESPFDKTLSEAHHPQRRGRLNKAYTMTVAIKRLTSQLDLQKPIVIAAVSRIRPSLRLVKAIDNSMGLPLFQAILRPDDRVFYVGSGSIQEAMAPETAALSCMRNINSDQRHVVMTCSRLCTSMMDQPRIALIQGPPGTGKSTTVAAMVVQLISRWRLTNLPNTPLPRILIAAPSNAAVDELVIKLMNVNEELPDEKKFKMMRVGPPASIHPKVRPILFENLLDENIRTTIRSGTNQQSVMLEIEQRQAALNKLGEEMVKEQNPAQVQLLHRKFKEEEAMLQRAKSSADPQLSTQEMNKMRYEGTEALFDHAEIIATTLSSSMNGYMERFFTTKGTYRASRIGGKFSICIVDEASQCVEPEMLIPFPLGFTKLVMIGDPEQLPATVSSVQAKEKSYGESMFKRLFKFFEAHTDSSNFLLKLRVQYRMHPEIVKWPNHYFYGGVLRQGSQIRDLPLFNYSLFNLNRTLTQTGGCNSICNEEEAEFVAKLAKVIQAEKDLLDLQNKSVGIITFYSRQRSLISRKLEELGLNVNSTDPRSISVRTVDGFQGSECDILIISCVRSRVNSNTIGFVSDEQRLNVALTRAKFALYVVGNFDVLRTNEMWRSMIEDAEKRHRLKNVSPRSDLKRLILPR